MSHRAEMLYDGREVHPYADGARRERAYVERFLRSEAKLLPKDQADLVLEFAAWIHDGKHVRP
jgi:hypothetical protein